MAFSKDNRASASSKSTSARDIIVSQTSWSGNPCPLIDDRNPQSVRTKNKQVSFFNRKMLDRRCRRYIRLSMCLLGPLIEHFGDNWTSPHHASNHSKIGKINRDFEHCIPLALEKCHIYVSSEKHRITPVRILRVTPSCPFVRWYTIRSSSPGCSLNFCSVVSIVKVVQGWDSPTITNKATKIYEGICQISHSTEEEVNSRPSDSPREVTRILCSIITPINTVDPAQARLRIG